VSKILFSLWVYLHSSSRLLDYWLSVHEQDAEKVANRNRET
jgi:hypothetical protein